MATGAVIVAGDNPGYSGLLQDRGKWSLVNPKDSAEFARRLDVMLFDTDLRQLWMEWADEYVKQFNYQHIVDLYEAVYESTIKRAHNAALKT